VFSEAKDDGGGGDNWSYESCKAPVKSSSPTNQHPVFLQAGYPSCRPTNSVKALKGKYHIPWTCLPQSHLGVFQLLSLTTNSSWLPWGRVAMPLISPLMPVRRKKGEYHNNRYDSYYTWKPGERKEFLICPSEISAFSCFHSFTQTPPFILSRWACIISWECKRPV